MNKKFNESNNIHKLRERIEYLEKVNRSTLNAFNLLGTLSSELARIKLEEDDSIIIKETKVHLDYLDLFQTMAFFMVKEDDIEFSLSQCVPISDYVKIQKEVEFQISDGTFAWALRQDRAIIIKSKNFENNPLVLHSLATKSQVIGMFVGILKDNTHSISDIFSDLLSTILYNSAQAIENSTLYKRINTQSQELKESNTRLQEEIEIRKKTENKLYRAKEVAEEANRMKSHFLANVSHEMRTPLNAIIGFTEIGLLSENLEIIYQHYNTILLESKNLLMLINDLLDHAKIEAGKLTIELITSDLTEVLELVQRTYEIQAKRKDLNFNVKIADNVQQFLKIDPLRLGQVLLNLVGNAIKFTEKGSVNVIVEVLDTVANYAKMRFSVIDTGIGIPKDKQKTIFKEFTQVDGSTTRKYGGTGLGTTIAHQLLGLMGGVISLESEPGKGSNFSFTIAAEICNPPKEKSQFAIHHEGRLIEVGKKKHHLGNILLAEDYWPNQEVAKLHLESVGYSVDIVNNGEEAVESTKNKKYDLILMDVQMPKIDGTEATKIIRLTKNKCRDVPIIAMTAHTEMSAREACRKVGMDDVITKPIQRNDFLGIVDRWLVHWAVERKKQPVEQMLEHHENKRKIRQKSTPLDYDEAIREFGGNKTLLDTVVTKFISDIDDKYKNFKDLLKNRNFEGIRKEAHKIRGGAINLTAVALANIAKDMEKSAEIKSYEVIENKLNEFGKELEKLKNFVLITVN